MSTNRINGKRRAELKMDEKVLNPGQPRSRLSSHVGRRKSRKLHVLQPRSFEHPVIHLPKHPGGLPHMEASTVEWIECLGHEMGLSTIPRPSNVPFGPALGPPPARPM